MSHIIKKTLMVSCPTPGIEELRVDESFMHPEILNAEIVFATNNNESGTDCPPLYSQKDSNGLPPYIPGR